MCMCQMQDMPRNVSSKNVDISYQQSLKDIPDSKELLILNNDNNIMYELNLQSE